MSPVSPVSLPRPTAHRSTPRCRPTSSPTRPCRLLGQFRISTPTRRPSNASIKRCERRRVGAWPTRPDSYRRSIVADGLTIARPAHLAGPCAAHSPRRPLKSQASRRHRWRSPPGALPPMPLALSDAEFAAVQAAAALVHPLHRSAFFASIGQGARGPSRRRPWRCAPLRGGPAEDLCRRGLQRNASAEPRHLRARRAAS